MRKRKKGIKLSRGQAARKALFRSLIRALVEYGSIETTEPKAKALERKIARLLNIARNDTVVAKRRVYSYLGNDRATADSIFKLAKRNFLKKSGGFTKIVKLSERRGDGARLVRLEWVKERTETSTSSDKNKENKIIKNKSAKSK